MLKRQKAAMWKTTKLQCGKRQSCSVVKDNVKKAKSCNVENDKAALWQKAKLQQGKIKKAKSGNVAKGKAAMWQKANL